MSIVNVEALKQNGCQLWWTGAVASSNSPKAITSAGDCKQILPFPGAGIGMFDGAGDYLTIPSSSDFNLSNNVWSIEGRFYIIGTFATAYQDIITLNGSSSGYGAINLFIDTSGKVASAFSSNGTAWINTGFFNWTTILSQNTWYHYAVVRTSDGYIKGYLNGVLDYTYNIGSTTLCNTDHITIGKITYTPPYYLNGYLSELRISNTVRYTANFTPSTQPFKPDPYTKLLINFNRNDTTFIDSSPSAHTITRYGDAKQLCSPCGSGIAYFDGTGDYLSTVDHADWDLVSTHYTLSFWFNTASTANQFIIGQCPDSGYLDVSGSWAIVLYNNNIAIIKKTGASSTGIESYAPFTTNTWYHVVIRSNGSYAPMVYVNGTYIATSDTIAYTSALALDIGKAKAINTWPFVAFNGYISDVAIKKGVSDSTVDARTTPIMPDSYTKLLLHMDGVGNAFYDSSDPPGDNGFPILPNGVTVTPNGTFTTQKMKDGRNVWKFDGSTNYITISDHTSWSMFTNDFTIVGWVKFDSIAADRIIIGQYVDVGNCWYVKWTPTGNLVQLAGVTLSISKFDYACTLVPVVGTWYHIAVQRKDSNCLMFINSISQSVFQSMPFSTSVVDIAAALSIGKINTGYQVGNIKDLQIFTKALNQDQIAAIYRETFVY